MKTRSVLAILLGVAVSSLAAGRDIGGVNLPDTVTAEGKTLKLNGGGIRTKAIFKVYVGALYLESPSRDAAAVVSSDQLKRMQLSLLRDLDKAKITEAITEGFDRNSKAQMGALKARLDRFNELLRVRGLQDVEYVDDADDVIDAEYEVKEDREQLGQRLVDRGLRHIAALKGSLLKGHYTYSSSWALGTSANGWLCPPPSPP